MNLKFSNPGFRFSKVLLRARVHLASTALVFACVMLALMTSSATAVTTPSFLLKFGEPDLRSDGKFDDPEGIAIDGFDNLYVADTFNNRIQKFTKNGTFITKWGSLGSGNGQFNQPNGIAVDGSGNVLVADSGNNRIQKFDSNGNFLAAWSTLSFPTGIAVDGSGNTYVADNGSNRIEKFDPNGTRLVLWGASGSSNGQFSQPWKIAIDSAGNNVYVTDANNNRVQQFDSTGNFVRTWGSYCNTAFGDCFGQFYLPIGIRVDSSNHVWVSDANNGRIEIFDAAGNYLSQWVSDLGFPVGQICGTDDFVFDSTGNIFVADNCANRVSKFDSAQNFIAQWGSDGSADGKLFFPRGVATDASGNVYVADVGNYRIQKFSASGSYLQKWGSFGDDAGQLRSLNYITIDSSGNIWIAAGVRIEKFTSNGAFLARWGWGVKTGANQFEICTASPCQRGIRGSGAGQFIGARGIAFDIAGNVYVAERYNYRVQKFSSSGTFLAMWGWGVVDGSNQFQICTPSSPTYPTCHTGSAGNGNGQFNEPWDIAVSGSGDVYVADRLNRRVQRFKTDGSIVGNWTVTNGRPRAVAVDTSGNVYVGSGNRVQEFSSDGTSIITQWGTFGYGDGQFEVLGQIAIDNSGNIYVVDQSAWRIDKFGNTTTGSNVSVSSTSGNTTTTVTFGTVSSAGSTAITTSSTAPPVPSGFQLGSTPTYYNVTSSATFNTASICINYDPAQYSNPSALTLLHYENNSWKNVTTSNDVPNHTICGNVTSLSPFAIGQDTTPPVITPTITGTAGSNGWYTSNVTINWNVADAESGISTSTNCGTTPLLTDTAGTTVTCSTTNGAGLSNSVSVNVKIDKTVPTITFTNRSAANANGWNNSNVVVNWSCADAGSGVTTATVSKTASAEGANQSASATCTDNAGNVSAPSAISNINIDKTAPVITGSRTPTANANGWNNSAVTVSFTCADTGSVQSGIDVNTVAGGILSNEGANQSVTNTGTCTDKAGNSAASATVSGINIDKSAPVFAACPIAGPFLNNSGAQAVGTISIDASIAGLAASGNTLTGSVDTSTVGAKNVTFTATDKAGNSASKTCSYNVIASATIQVVSALHTVGSGTNPGTTKTPLALDLRVYDKAVVGSPDPKDFGTTWNSGTGIVAPLVVISSPTVVNIGGGNANQYNILVAASPNTLNSGSYLVIGKATVDSQTVYVGSPTDPLAANSVTQKFLQVIKTANGKITPATTTAVPGSMLLIVEPAYLEFTSATELLPIVYESVDGTWSDVVQANPPEGFVSTPGALTVDVSTSQLRAVQFTVKDVGSSWTFTKITHRLKHKGQEKVITHNISMVNKQKKK